jgi:hypothetical protein
MAFLLEKSENGVKGLPLFKLGIPSPKDCILRYFRHCVEFGLCNIINSYKQDGDSGWVDKFKYYIVLSTFRVFTILQGVYFRFLKGNASSTLAKKYGETAMIYANLGFNVMNTRKSILFPLEGIITHFI